MAKKTILPPKVYAYTRVSTDAQDVANQEFEITNYCNINKLVVDEWHSHVITGASKLEDRKGGDFIKTIPNGSILIVTELTRLGRSVFDLFNMVGYLLEKGVVIHVIKQTVVFKNDIQSKMFLSMLSIAAELERDLIAQRTKQTFARMKANNIKYCRRPLYGFKVVPIEQPNPKKPNETIIINTLEKDDKEFQFVLDVFKLADEGLGARRIANILSDKYKTIRDCKRIYPNTIQSILNRKEQYAKFIP